MNTSDHKKSTVIGACFCGAVRFELELPSKFLVHCHCSECRRAGGAPMVTWLGTFEKNLRVTQGQDKIRAYRHTEDSNREFCSHCGSQLFFRCDRWPGEVHVTRATIAGETDRAPQAHVFYSDKAEWFDPEKHLTRLGGEDGTTPI